MPQAFWCFIKIHSIPCVWLLSLPFGLQQCAWEIAHARLSITNSGCTLKIKNNKLCSCAATTRPQSREAAALGSFNSLQPIRELRSNIAARGSQDGVQALQSGRLVKTPSSMFRDHSLSPSISRHASIASITGRASTTVPVYTRSISASRQSRDPLPADRRSALDSRPTSLTGPSSYNLRSISIDRQARQGDLGPNLESSTLRSAGPSSIARISQPQSFVSTYSSSRPAQLVTGLDSSSSSSSSSSNSSWLSRSSSASESSSPAAVASGRRTPQGRANTSGLTAGIRSLSMQLPSPTAGSAAPSMQLISASSKAAASSGSAVHTSSPTSAAASSSSSPTQSSSAASSLNR